MSGHSKWSTIKRQKGAADQKRGMTFTKLANAITIATKQGGSGDPESNHRLRLAIEQAKSVNMPKENVQRAIDRGLGKLPGQSLEEVVYEGFGPSKVAFLVEGVTDNKLRTTQIIKNIFERSGGGLGSQGSTAYMFEKKGLIKVKSKEGSAEEQILEIIDLGADDVEELEEDGVKKFLVYSSPTELTNMSNKLTQKGFSLESHEQVFEPTITVNITEKEPAQKVLEFIEKLEENEDIHNVHANFNIPEDLMTNL